MTIKELAEIGLTPDDVCNKLVDRLEDHYVSEGPESCASDFNNRIEKAVKTRIDEVLSKAMQEHILPKITEMVEGINLQETNRWGEAIKKPVTFIEYLTARADAYIQEEVNHNGKTKDQESYSWRKSSTRIAYMIHEHLQYSIERAMTKALGDVNSSVRKGLEEATNIALSKIQVQVKTEVKTT